METLEKPTVPSPAKLAEMKPALTQAALVEVAPTEVEVQAERPNDLGVPAQTREEYRVNNEPRVTESDFTTVEPSDTESENDDEVREELFSGFHVEDSTRDNDVDELPEGVDLGEPDDDEVKA